jgi:type II secretory pathway predicted ATPase ExeA/septal ring-binding cell division protein DamX
METGQMQEEQQQAHQSPFDHGLFFPDNGRKSTLEILRNAVAGSVSLITCIGEEGHGKTMLCKILEKEISAPYLVISFPYSVESFDYVLQIIALKLNLKFSIADNAMGSGHLLLEIARTLQEQQKKLLILFDEAEKLYLATLERVRKMIDIVNEDTVLLQIILFGRIEFQEHIKQLSLCTFKTAQELHLTLQPLTKEGTFQYLNFCMKRRPGFEKKDIFSREVAAKILAVSHGNFRKINSLAEDSLRSSSYTANTSNDGTSFMVLLEHVKDSDDLTEGKHPAHRLPSSLIQKKAAIGAGIFLVAILLFLSINQAGKKPIPPTPAAISKPVVNPLPPTPAPTPEPVIEVVPPLPAANTEPAIKPDTPAPITSTESTVKPAPPIPTVNTEPAIKPAPQAPAANTEASATLVSATPVTIAEPEAKVKLRSVEIAPLVEKKSAEIQIITANKSPKKHFIPLLTPEIATKNSELLSKGNREPKTNISQQLPRKSLAIGNKWLEGDKNDQFTLQVMVLATDQAAEKLKQILREEDQEGLDKFVILKKTTSPTAFLLFYGEYSTIAEARNARNNLPQSLQEYTPYPVSIKHAVEKAKQ